MDRTQDCGSCNVGSIPTEGTNERSEFCVLKHGACALCGEESKRLSIFPDLISGQEMRNLYRACKARFLLRAHDKIPGTPGILYDPLFSLENLFAPINCFCTELFFESQELVVLGHTIGARE